MKKEENITSTEQYVESRMRSAVLTLKRMPAVKVQGYISLWPNVIREPLEILQMEPNLLKIRPSSRDITELEEILFYWLPLLTVDERKLLWLRAYRTPWKAICWQFGCGRTKAWEMYKHVLGKIAMRI